MRLFVSFFILVVTALDFAFGQPDRFYLVASLVSGLLVASTVIADHLRVARRNGTSSSEASPPAGASAPPET
jgi:hypothetical protein